LFSRAHGMQSRTTSTGAPATDLELVQQYKITRDRAFLGALFERYSRLALGLSLRYLRNREDAEDAVMEVYEHLTTALVKHEVENFKNWLYSVVANHCRMVLRRRKVAPATVEASDELLDAVLASVPAPDRDDELDQQIEALTSALAQLVQGQRSCLDMFYLQGHSYAEVARRCGYTVNEVKSHIQNGKRSLRILLQERSRSR
jgi:RNA polymerase sigma-70 factor, ECF subfamily